MASSFPPPAFGVCQRASTTPNTALALYRDEHRSGCCLRADAQGTHPAAFASRAQRRSTRREFAVTPPGSSGSAPSRGNGLRRTPEPPGGDRARFDLTDQPEAQRPRRGLGSLVQHPSSRAAAEAATSCHCLLRAPLPAAWRRRRSCAFSFLPVILGDKNRADLLSPFLHPDAGCRRKHSTRRLLGRSLAIPRNGTDPNRRSVSRSRQRLKTEARRQRAVLRVVTGLEPRAELGEP